MLMLLSSKSKVFFVSEKSYPGPNLIQFHLKGNNKSKSVSKDGYSMSFLARYSQKYAQKVKI